MLFIVQLTGLSDISPWLDKTLLGIVASGLAFGIVFLIRRPAAKTEASSSE
jgi:hypothetical protein